MNIGNANEASGVPAKMILYYEETGPIPNRRRSDGGYRKYQATDVHTLRFINDEAMIADFQQSHRKVQS